MYCPCFPLSFLLITETKKMAKDSQKLPSDEINLLYTWCMTIIIYISSIAEPQCPALTDFFEAVIREQYEKRSLRGLKQISGDLREWANGLNMKKQRELDELLHAKVGRGLKEGQRLFEKHVNAILKRGKIRNSDEAELLLQRADEIYSDKEKENELKKINVILAKYEGSALKL